MPEARRTRLPRVVLVGRPNVGKSTLFNRVTGARRAIVTPVPGTTRDVLAGEAEWDGRRFRLVDTGGMFGASEDPLQPLVVEQGRRALADADVVVFVVDGREGPLPADEEIAAAVRRLDAPVVVAVNKIDDRRARDGAVEFHEYGFPLVEIAAEHGLGVGELLDAVALRIGPEDVGQVGRVGGAEDVADPTNPARLGREADRSATDDPAAPDGPGARDDTVHAANEAVTAVAIIGRPNVGKSSLVNRLLREERVMVSDVPGTTRDAIDTRIRWHGRDLVIVDTAGIRRPGRVARGGQVEEISVLVARRAIARADVAVVMIDAEEGVTDQDAAIAGEALEAGCGLVVAVNKWDLKKRSGEDVSRAFDEELRRRLKFLDFVPLLHVSALTGERVGRLLETVDRVAAARRRRVATAELNDFVARVTAAHAPSSPSRREVRIRYMTQTGVAPPRFAVFTNATSALHFSYERYLVNRLRDAFGFEGTPIRLQVRRRAARRRPGGRGGRSPDRSR